MNQVFFFMGGHNTLWNFALSSCVSANCNLKLIQLFFELVKDVVANLGICPHRENGQLRERPDTDLRRAAPQRSARTPRRRGRGSVQVLSFHRAVSRGRPFTQSTLILALDFEES